MCKTSFSLSGCEGQAKACPTPREAVRRMAPYSPPSAGREGKLRLDFNENTVGCSPAVIEFLRERLTADRLSIYPEYVEAVEELAGFFGISEREFTLTNGTDEAIQLLVNTYIDDGGDVIVLKPSYAMYRFYADLAGAAVREIEFRRETLAFPLEEILTAISPSTRAILVANPNNPTGTGIDAEDVRRILEAAPGAVVLIDEAYFEFSGVTVLPCIRAYPNLFVSRTFSKVYGMAAMRCGCLFSSSENVQWLKKAQSPYSVNSLAALAARAAIRDQDYITQYVAEALEARALLCDGFDRLGIRYYPSRANFVLFQAADRSIEIRDTLRERGVLVRDRSYEVPGCVRVTAGTRQQAQLFLTELEKLWNR
ncbi:MAG: histidinol-phosphate transaminase [Bryobacterales bacterium]|nr:histidinol-phosphate transaminase [Bryobacterales bacterium]